MTLRVIKGTYSRHMGSKQLEGAWCYILQVFSLIMFQSVNRSDQLQDLEYSERVENHTLIPLSHVLNTFLNGLQNNVKPFCSLEGCDAMQFGGQVQTYLSNLESLSSGSGSGNRPCLYIPIDKMYVMTSEKVVEVSVVVSSKVVFWGCVYVSVPLVPERTYDVALCLQCCT